jgi:hypothetical protein
MAYFAPLGYLWVSVIWPESVVGFVNWRVPLKQRNSAQVVRAGLLQLLLLDDTCARGGLYLSVEPARQQRHSVGRAEIVAHIHVGGNG